MKKKVGANHTKKVLLDMRIAILVIGNSRRSNYLNGFNIRYGKAGCSGTDSSSILVAEYLADQGHDVVLATEQLEDCIKDQHIQQGNIYTPGDKIRGVQYTNLNFDNINLKEFDILISMLWFKDYGNLPIKVTKKLIYWCHMQWIYEIDGIIKYTRQNNLDLTFVHISEWEKSQNINLIEHIKEYNKDINITTALIPNPIADDLIKETIKYNIPKKKHKFIFHASWARGGDVAVSIVDKLNWPDKQLHAFDYLITIHDHKYPFFYRHDAVDKITLFKHLAESEYFLYPLYTPYQDIHKDTFSCVVAEALAMGVIVLTYPIAALPKNFNPYCVWVDFPDNVDINQIQKEPLTKDIDGKFKYNENSFISKLKYLEENPYIKERLKSKGQNYILEQFNSNKISDLWKGLLY